MIFIVGYTFVAGKSENSQPYHSGSILQQVNENKLQHKLGFENSLTPGQTYELVRIKPNIKNKIPDSFEYQFLEVSTGQIKTLEFKTIDEGDLFVARASGKLNEFRKQKEAASTEVVI